MSNNSRVPMYVSIQEYIKNEIASGNLKPHDKIPSEAKLMEQFFVSRITVSNALTAMAKEGYIYRVPGRGTFISDDFAKLNDEIKSPEGSIENEHQSSIPSMEHKRKTKRIAFLIPGLNDFFSINILQGIRKAIHEDNSYSLLVKISEGRDSEADAIKEMQGLGIDGMIIFPADQETYNNEILALKVNRFPFVLIDRYLPGVETNFVGSNNVIGGQMAVSHLYDLGHRNIAICGSTLLPTSSTDDRVRGYLNELKNKGEMIDPELIINDIHIDYESPNTNAQLMDIIKNRKATAFIATNSRLAMYLYFLCDRLKIRVPEDASILSYDDPLPEYREFGLFTHITQSEFEMGVNAMHLLMDILSDKHKDGKAEKIIFDPKLIIRKSTASKL